MPVVDIVIARPVAAVWQVFTGVEHWAEWWGGPLLGVTPGWQGGAKVVWGQGEESLIGRFTPEKECQIVSRWVENWFTFSAIDDRSTRLELAFGPRGGASFSDGGLAHMKNLAASLARFKELVEKETAEGV